ncbi:MAG: DUF1598 domain-containing protein [Pirellulaceae bacterium]|nr:DUF1598 domain-containing protein [Pirellulaceae bacterium]
MNMGNRWARFALGLAATLSLASSVGAQNVQNNNLGGGGALPAGVLISPDGVLRIKQFDDKSGALSKTRAAEARAKLGAALAKPSDLRKISLNRLEAAMTERLAAGMDPTDEMKYLAGLTRLQYVFYYPETKDIVIAGPAEGFVFDASARMVGLSSGRAVLELQDLATALRAYPPAGKQTHEIMVSIDPTQEGLKRMADWLATIRPGPGDAQNIVNGLKEKLGLHNVSIAGVSPRSHFAQVMVEADYRMKLIGIGIESPPVRMVTYIGRASPSEVSRNAMERWFFTPNYDCVRVSDDQLAMELVGEGVKLVGANELVRADGSRVGAAGGNSASKAFCDSFTALYPQIAAKNPVYAQLRNLIDVAVAAAFIQKQDYYGQAGWKAEVLLDEAKYPIETYETPKTVETACAAHWKGSRLMTPVGGGVQMNPTDALQASHLLKDEDGKVNATHKQVQLGLAKGQWWWD